MDQHIHAKLFSNVCLKFFVSRDDRSMTEMYREQGFRRLDRFYDLFDLVDLLEYSCKIQVQKSFVSPYEHL